MAGGSILGMAPGNTTPAICDDLPGIVTPGGGECQ